MGDKVSNKTSNKLINKNSEEESVESGLSVLYKYANMIESYQVERRRLNGYAGRRGRTELVKGYAGGKS